MNNSTQPIIHNATYSFCIDVLYLTVASTGIRYWDLFLSVPTAVFMVFVLTRLPRVIERLRRNRSPIFTAFFFLVSVAAVVCTLRCIIAMVAPVGSVIINKLAWLITRFVMLFVESSFVVFALVGSKLENSTKSVSFVVLVTVAVTATYSSAQIVLELGHFYDDSAYVEPYRSDLYEYGGMLFWFISSVIFCILYAIIFALGFVPSEKLCITLPGRKSFYWYVGFVFILNLLQAIGSGVLYFSSMIAAYCLVEMASLVYFAIFNPVVYLVFLRGFFKSRSAVALTQRLPSTTAASANTTRRNSIASAINSSSNYRRTAYAAVDATAGHSYSTNLNEDELLNTSISCDDEDEQLLSPFEYSVYSALSMPQSIQSAYEANAAHVSKRSSVNEGSFRSDDSRSDGNSSGGRSASVLVSEPSASNSQVRPVNSQQRPEATGRSPRSST